MTHGEQEVLEKGDQQREVYIGFLQDLVRASEGGEEATQRYVAARFRDLGCDVQVIKYTPRALPMRREFVDASVVDPAVHTSVVGMLRGTGDGRSLILFAQADTEPVGRTKEWKHPPFEAVVEDGRIYGWGVADDLSGVAAMTCAAEAVLEAGLKPRGDLILASVPSKRLARGIIAVLDHGYEADAAVYVHPAESGEGLDEIKQATPGLISFRIFILGRLPPTLESGHTAFHHLAVDPLEKAWVVYEALRDLDERRAREVSHPAMEETIGRSTNLNIAYLRYGEEAKLTRVSPHCVLAGTVTLPPGEEVSDVQSQISQAVREAADKDSWLREHPPQLKWLVGFSGTEVPTDHPLYQTVSQAVTVITGSKPHINPLHAASDIKNPMLFKDIPAVGLGPTGGNLGGGHDEWVDVDSYVETVKVVASIISNWCGA